MANKSQKSRDNKGLKPKKADSRADMRPHEVRKRESAMNPGQGASKSA